MNFLRLILIILLVYIIFRIFWKKDRSRGSRRKQYKKSGKGVLEEMKRDPVCGTYIPESQAIKASYKDEIHYFCSQECRDVFLNKNK